MDLGIIPIKRTSASTDAAEETTQTTPASTVIGLSDWEADEELRRIERKLRNSLKQRQHKSESIGRQIRVDSAHEELGRMHRTKPVRAKSDGVKTSSRKLRADMPKSKKSSPARGSAILAFLTRMTILLGVAALLGGGIALGYSVFGSRPDYWNFGLPFVIGGQIVLLVGLVLQLDRVWRENRTAAAKLDEVDEELHDLKTTAALLSTSHSPSAGSFYAHYAGGANAQLLLTDLKSQLDLLAIKIAREEE
jgi:hypothetical protein